MTLAPAPTSRPLGPGDLPTVLGIAERAGVHGVYVRNSLLGDSAERGELLGLFDGDGGAVAFGWYGHRGNLIVIQDRPVDPLAAAAALRGGRSDWRICLGPAEVVRRMASAEASAPLVHREQVYYVVEAGGVSAARVRDDVRLATRQDVRALVGASLDLNESDLNVAPWRVHRGWLRDSVKRRLRLGLTFVIGPEGEPVCKLDLGSAGPAGVVIEGVHTLPAARDKGLATGLVATVAARLLGSAPLVCLHVAADNFAARRAYERAGMEPRGSCRILLRA